ncbi:MAG: hypothetical protein J6R42_05360 [Clostridia bacterium]|nr:hypothetical protein [Clostridia bacterium]
MLQEEKTAFVKKWENYWYHYKWHTIVAIFLVFVILISTLQSCNQTEVGVIAMYAGPKTLSTKQIQQMGATLRKISVKSGNEDLVADIYDYPIGLKPGEGHGGETGKNVEVFDNEIMVGNAVILFLSPALYERLKESNGGIVPLDPYLPEQTEHIVFYDESHLGIYLSSLPLYMSEGFCDLPSDTLVCMRSAVSVKNLFEQKKAQEKYQEYVRMMPNLLSYVPEG